MTRGSIVRRKEDPVHSGRVIRVDVAGARVNVRWFGGPRGTLEYMIPMSDLELAEDWKNGQAVPAQTVYTLLVRQGAPHKVAIATARARRDDR